MDTEGDLYCTCDVGPFATCPVCRARSARSANMTTVKPRPKQKFSEQSEAARLAQRFAEIKVGYMK